MVHLMVHLWVHLWVQRVVQPVVEQPTELACGVVSLLDAMSLSLATAAELLSAISMLPSLL